MIFVNKRVRFILCFCVKFYNTLKMSLPPKWAPGHPHFKSGPDHISQTLADLHWLRAPERIAFKMAVLTYRCLHGTAPGYLAGQLRRVADKPNRRQLRSSATLRLDVPRTHLSTIGDRAFPVAASRFWNTLPDDITAAASLPVFRRQLKTYLFAHSYR